MPKKMAGYKWTLGARFSSKEEFKEAISNYSVCNAKDLKFLKNDKTRVRVGCKDGCPWVALCSKIPEEDTWQLRKLDDNHTCGHEFSIRFLNSEWLGKKLMPNVRENPNIKLTTISNKAHEKWNVKVSRMKAYRARKKDIDMVDGSFREQYRRLHDYGHEILRSNPHSSVKIQVQPIEQHEVPIEKAYISRPLLPSFQRMYMCIDGCKQSFFKCRPFIGLDGCFLKGYYGGMILAAVGRDPNDQMLPIALAVVEGVTKDSWTWFLKWLIKDLGGTDECKKITFMSDQQKGLLPAIEDLLPDVEQRFCVRHLYSNFRKRFAGKALKDLIWKAAKASYPQLWEKTMREIRTINPEAHTYLIKNSPRFWSKSYFTYNSKCDVLVNNMSETFNSVILGPREKPIITMFEEIRGYLMERWAKNRVKHFELEPGSILPNIKKKLLKESENSRFWICRRWMLSGIPCCNAITCCKYKALDPANFIPEFYKKEAYVRCYEPVTNPTNGENLWESTPYPDILPPPMKKMPGRPKRSRNKGADEKAKKARDPSLVTRKGKGNKCSICKQFGHKKSSCKDKLSSSGSAQTTVNQPNPTAPTTQIAQNQPNPTTFAVQTAQNQPNPTASATETAQNRPNPTASATQTTHTASQTTKRKNVATKKTSTLFKEVLAPTTFTRQKMQPRKPAS